MVIFNESKIKYEKLDSLFGSQLTDLRFSQYANMIIDLKEIIKKFFRPGVMPEASNTKAVVEEMSSDIINTIGHYRNYFYKKGKYTQFFVLYSYKKCEELLSIMPNYKAEYYSRHFDGSQKALAAERAIKAVEKVCAVIPNCIFIDTSAHDEMIYAKTLINDIIPENQMTIILSNDPVMFQTLKKNAFILNIKGIKSELITTETAAKEMTDEEDAKFSSAMIPLLLSLVGNKKYCFSGIGKVGMSRGVSITNDLLGRGIALDIDSVEVPVDFSKLSGKKSKIDQRLIDDQQKIKATYAIVRNDLNYFRYRNAISNDIAAKKAGKRTRNYVDDFKELNAKVFSRYPLNAGMILKGEVKR